MRTSPLAGTLLVAAALALAAPAAPARAPTTADQGSVDWILQRINKDREAEKGVAGSVDPLASYTAGQGPLTDWEKLLPLINEIRQGSVYQREAAVEAVRKRFKFEEEQKRVDPGALTMEKRRFCRATLELMLRDDHPSRVFGQNIQKFTLPSDLIPPWDPSDSRAKRNGAYDILKRRLPKYP